MYPNLRFWVSFYIFAAPTNINSMNIDDFKTATKEELLALPVRKEVDIKKYRWFIAVPTGIDCENGYGELALVGYDEENKKHEIVNYCESFCFIMNEENIDITCDMLSGSSCMRYFSKNSDFEISAFPLSSIEINVVKRHVEE